MFYYAEYLMTMHFISLCLCVYFPSSFFLVDDLMNCSWAHREQWWFKYCVFIFIYVT